MIFLEPDEKILLTVRKHWLFLLKEMVVLLGLLALPLILIFIYEIFALDGMVAFQGTVGFLWTGLAALWALYCATLIFMIWTDYYLDVLVVTTKRIFDVEQRGLFFRNSSSFRLDRVQDITVTVSGVLATFMNFGTIHIQTAGDAREFVATYIPQPYDVKRLITEEQDRVLERSPVVRIEEARPAGASEKSE